MIEQTLHGLVVGLGKIRKDGSKEFRWLEKPIHNRIVSGGLDYLLMLNGNNNNKYEPAVNASAGSARVYNPFRRHQPNESSSAQYNGCIQFMSIGTDGSSTSFTDTALKAQVGGYSQTVPYSTVPYNGTMVESRNVTTLHFRVTLQSVAVENDVTIREIGWHGKYYNQEVYPMFSRVILPIPMSLTSGESLIVCYQLNVTTGYDEREIPSSILSYFLDSDGNQARAFTKRLVLNGVSYDTDFGKYISADSYIKEYGISSSGLGTVSNSFEWLTFIQLSPFYYGSVSNSFRSSYLYYSTDLNFSYPVPQSWWNQPPTVEKDTVTQSFCTLEDHVIGTNYRDMTITVGPAWPNISSNYLDIYGIVYYGQVIRFGHYDNTDPDNPVWVPKPWRKQFGQSYKFTFRYKLSTADTQ